MSLEQCIIRHSRKSLGEIESAQRLLNMVDGDPTSLTQRIIELHYAHFKLMERFSPNTDKSKYPHALALRDFLNAHDAFLDTRSPLNISSLPHADRSAQKTFAYIANHLGDEWSFVTTTPDDAQRMSKMLLGGYARFLEVDTKVSRLAALYETAMMEVLQNDFPSSMLATDLLHYASQHVSLNDMPPGPGGLSFSQAICAGPDEGGNPFGLKDASQRQPGE